MKIGIVSYRNLKKKFGRYFFFNCKSFLIQIQTSKLTKNVKKQKVAKWKKKEAYTPFPPAQQPSKIDLQLETGEYFLNESERRKQKLDKTQEKQNLRKIERKRLRAAELVPPKEPLKSKMMKLQENIKNDNKLDLNKLKDKVKSLK